MSKSKHSKNPIDILRDLRFSIHKRSTDQEINDINKKKINLVVKVSKVSSLDLTLKAISEFFYHESMEMCYNLLLLLDKPILQTLLMYIRTEDELAKQKKQKVGYFSKLDSEKFRNLMIIIVDILNTMGESIVTGAPSSSDSNSSIDWFPPPSSSDPDPNKTYGLIIFFHVHGGTSDVRSRKMLPSDIDPSTDIGHLKKTSTIVHFSVIKEGALAAKSIGSYDEFNSNVLKDMKDSSSISISEINDIITKNANASKFQWVSDLESGDLSESVKTFTFAAYNPGDYYINVSTNSNNNPCDNKHLSCDVTDSVDTNMSYITKNENGDTVVVPLSNCNISPVNTTTKAVLKTLKKMHPYVTVFYIVDTSCAGDACGYAPQPRIRTGQNVEMALKKYIKFTDETDQIRSRARNIANTHAHINAASKRVTHKMPTSLQNVSPSIHKKMHWKRLFGKDEEQQDDDRAKFTHNHSMPRISMSRKAPRSPRKTPTSSSRKAHRSPHKTPTSSSRKAHRSPPHAQNTDI